MEHCAVIILASGLSERMGEPKAMLRWDRETSFLEKIISTYTNAGCQNLVCMINSKTEAFCRNLKTKHSVKFVLNLHPEWGRFYSVKTAAQEVKDCPYCFIQNVDNPFVEAEIIEKLFEKRNPDAWCSPVYQGKGGHPVLLSQMIIQKIAEAESNDITLNDILKHCIRIQVEAGNDTVLRNINTPEEYAAYFKTLI